MDEYNNLATYPIDYDPQSYLKTPGTLYYQGMFMGFDQRNSTFSQILIEQNLEKVTAFWLVRNIKEAKMMSEQLLHLIENDIPRQELTEHEFEQQKRDGERHLDFYRPYIDSWMVATQSERFQTIDGSEWVLKIYPNGHDSTLPSQLTLSLEILRDQNEDQFFMKKIELDVIVFLLSYVPKSAKKEMIFMPGQQENFVVLDVDFNYVSAYTQEFFKNAAVFQINLCAKPICPTQWNTELKSLIIYEGESIYQENKKEELSFSGIQNSGMMCYLISLMQTYFHIPAFRDFVFNINTQEIQTVEGTNSLPLALQKLFYNLSGLQKINERALRSHAHKLVEGGINRVEVVPNMIEVGISLKNQGFQDYQQEDISEFLLRITDELERITLSNYNESQHMNQEVRRRGTMYKLFNGDTSSLIQCVDFPNEEPSVNTEIFAMLQLEVLNTKNIKESLIKFLAPQKLCGNNKYHSEQHGLQDAWKWQEISSLPPVLFLTLKRFNFFIGAGQKVNTRFEFSQFLDMDSIMAEARERQAQEMGNQFVGNSELKGENKYRLLSIMMHAEQDVGMGHYYAYIKPHIQNKESTEWLEFNDFSVRPVIKEEAFEKAYGGELYDYSLIFHEIYKKSFGYRKYSAYMLCYLRERDLKFLLKPVNVPIELSNRFEYENEMSNAIAAQVSTAYTRFHIFAMSNETLAGWQGFGPFPPSQFGVSLNQDEESSTKLYSSGIFRSNRLFRFKDQIPKTIFRDNRQISMFSFQDYHRLVAKKMNLPLHSIRLWLCTASRYNPEIMCVSSFLKSDLPLDKPDDFLFDGEMEVKQCQMLNANCDTFNGGIFIELVERESQEWKESDPITDAVVFVQKDQRLVDKEEEVIEYYEKHAYEGRRAVINTEVQIYSFAEFSEKEEKKHGTFSRVPEKWKESKQEEKKQENREEQKGRVIQIDFDENRKICKVGHNTPKTESGGPSPPHIGNPENQLSMGAGFSPHDKQERSESVLGQMGEPDAPSPNLSPMNNNNNEEDQENINPLTEQGLKSIKDSTMIRARKQKIREEHKYQRTQHQSYNLYRLESKAKLIFIKFFLNGCLTLTDVRGMTFPSIHSQELVLGKEIFARYLEQFDGALLSINNESSEELQICVYRETRMKQLRNIVKLEEFQPAREVDLEEPLFTQEIENGDCFILATPERGPHPSTSHLYLNQYLADNILKVKVLFIYKARKFQNQILQDKWMQKLRRYTDSPYSSPFNLDVKLTTSLESLAERLQNQRYIYTPNLLQRIVFFREKESEEQDDNEINPQSVMMRGKRDKGKRDKFKECTELRWYNVQDILIQNERILFHILPFYRRDMTCRSSFLLNNVLVSSLTNTPYLLRQNIEVQKKQVEDGENSKIHYEYEEDSAHRSEIDRKAYESLLVSTIWQTDCVANIIEARKYVSCTAGDLKQEIFKILTDNISLIGKANSYARNQKLPIRFKKTLDLKSVSQILVLREAALKQQPKAVDMNITERVILKIFSDEEKVWILGQENKQISDLNSNIRVLIVPFENPLWHNLEHNLWPSRYPQFPVSPRLKEALEDVLDEREQLKEERAKLNLSQYDVQKLNQYFTLKFQHPKCFFVQCRVLLQDNGKILSDIFLLPYHTDAASVSSFLLTLCSDPQAPVISFRNRKSELKVLTKKDLLDNVSYQIARYRLVNPEFFRRSIFAPKKPDDSHKKPFLRKEASTISLALKHPVEKRSIGKNQIEKKFPFAQVMSGVGSTMKEAFSLGGPFKNLVPSPVVLQIVIGKELY